MIRLIKAGDGEPLGLPGRRVLEVVSGNNGGASLTFRIVEIPVPAPGETLRGPHLHHGHEECIYVLHGKGSVQCANGPLDVKPGDVLLVPPEVPHVTRNVGADTLVLLCFFPTPDVSRTTEDARPAPGAIASSGHRE